MKYCSNCGAEIKEGADVCIKCGKLLSKQDNNPNAKSKIAAGILGIFFGGWGIHNFYLGNTNRGILQIIVTIITCGIGSVWGLVEGIMILTGNISTDYNGVPLKD